MTTENRSMPIRDGEEQYRLLMENVKDYAIFMLDTQGRVVTWNIGALLLAKAGLLDGLEATTHHGAIDLLRQTAPKTPIHADRRFVDNGRVICSAGITAGIDMSLHVLGRLQGREVAEKTARQMEYPLQS